MMDDLKEREAGAKELHRAEVMAGYVLHYWKGCRDCADENGICPFSKLPCLEQEEAVMSVCRALEYGFAGNWVDPQYALPTAEQSDKARIAQLEADLARERAARGELVDHISEQTEHVKHLLENYGAFMWRIGVEDVLRENEELLAKHKDTSDAG